MTLNLDQTKHFANKKEKAENPEENNNEQKKSEKLELGSGTQFVSVFFSLSCLALCLMNEYSHFPSYAKQQTFTQISPKNQRTDAERASERGKEASRRKKKSTNHTENFSTISFSFPMVCWVDATSLLHFNFRKWSFCSLMALIFNQHTFKSTRASGVKPS